MMSVIKNCPLVQGIIACRRKGARWIEQNPDVLLAGLFFILSPEVAMAGGIDDFLCTIAKNFKAVVGTCALVAIVFWAIEHVFGVSKIHDMVIKIGVACAVIAGAATLISATNLGTNCTI